LEGFIPGFLSAKTDKTVDFFAVGIEKNDSWGARNVKIFTVLGIPAVGILGLDSERDVGFVDEFSDFGILPDKLVQRYAAPSRG